MQHDLVNHPPHYTQGDIQCIDAIKAALTPEEYRGFLKGNMLKYTWRERHKGGLESIEKAIWYGNRLIKDEMADAELMMQFDQMLQRSNDKDAYDKIEEHHFWKSRT